jgi:hypothetical protein
MTPNPALGVTARFAIGATTTVDKPLDFERETLSRRSSFLDPQGLRGTVAHAANRVRENSRIVAGDVTHPAPTAVELSYMLPYILGGTPSGTSYPLGETLSAFYASQVRGGSHFQYAGCRINSATFSSRKGTALQVTNNIVGIGVSKNPNSGGTAMPSLTLDNTTGFFAHEDLVLTVNGDTIDVFSWQLTFNNVVLMRQVNSVTPTAVYRTDRIITARVEVPWGDDEALYDLAVGGVTLSSVFTNGGTSLSFTCPKFQVPPQDPDVEGRDEMHNILEGMCRYSAAPGDECATVLDSTP